MLRQGPVEVEPCHRARDLERKKKKRRRRKNPNPNLKKTGRILRGERQMDGEG